jgi:hypothetical protein
MDRPRPAMTMLGTMIAVVAAPIMPGNLVDLINRGF